MALIQLYGPDGRLHEIDTELQMPIFQQIMASVWTRLFTVKRNVPRVLSRAHPPVNLVGEATEEEAEEETYFGYKTEPRT